MSVLPPTASDDLFAGNGQSILSGNLIEADNGSGSDTNGGGAPLFIASVNGEPVLVGTTIALPSGALLTVGSDGAFTYDPNGAFEGLVAGTTQTDTFVYELSDGTQRIVGPGAFEASIDLAALDESSGFVLSGIDPGDRAGFSVSSAGDVNGDGLDDLIIGAPRADPGGAINAGETYVVFGSSAGFGSELSLATLDGSNGFVINGIDPFDVSGSTVSSAGDVNGDGIDDLIVGADSAHPNGKSFAGGTYVVFGRRSGFGASMDLAALSASNGATFDGIDPFDFSGRSVSSAGDINGDGIDDLIVGADGGDPNAIMAAGESYVVFGAAGGFGATFDLASLNGTNGFAINGIAGYDFSGRSVSNAGDINGDGIDDLIVAARTADPDGKAQAGESYVVFGSRSPFASHLNLSSLNGGNGFVIEGVDGNDQSGASVASAGDLNGDGIDDLIIGAPGAAPNGAAFAGEAYVVFGSAGGFAARLLLSSLNGKNGFAIHGVAAHDAAGSSVSAAGDVNGDGIDDLIVGATGVDLTGRGEAGTSYVVFGTLGGWAPSLDLASLNGTNGFRVEGAGTGDMSGRSVAAAGDVNGDGIADLIIGADNANTNGQVDAGEAYVLYGRATTEAITDEGSVVVQVTANDPATLALVPTLETVDENTPLLADLKVADIRLTDDGAGLNTFALTGPHAHHFRFDANTLELFLKAGTTLDFERTPRFNVTVEVDDAAIGSSPDHTATFSLSLNNLNEIMETGTLLIGHQPITVDLLNTYIDPVVVAFVATHNDLEPVAVRIDALTASTLTLRLQEPHYLDRPHAPETVNYIVAERGHWTLADGTRFAAGAVDSDRLTASGFGPIVFEDGLFTETPAILSGLQTNNDPDWVITRQRDADAHGFEIAMQRTEARNGSIHATEELGYLAIEHGRGSAHGFEFQAGSTAGLTHDETTVAVAPFSGDERLHVVAQLATFAGKDPSVARGTGTADGQFGVFIQEETSRDDEIGHNNAEALDWFAFSGPATFTGTAFDPFI